MNKERAGAEETRTEKKWDKKQSKAKQNTKSTKQIFYLYAVIFKFLDKDIPLKGL